MSTNILKDRSKFDNRFSDIQSIVKVMSLEILITGVTGMAGSHPTDYVLNNHRDVEAHGVLRWWSPLNNIIHIKRQVRLHHADLYDLNPLIHVMKFVWPNRIFHLAAQLYVLERFLTPADTLQVNLVCTINLLGPLRWADMEPLIYISSLSEVYGQAPEDEVPINESNSFPLSRLYAVSKVGEDMVTMQYFIVRDENYSYSHVCHTGPRRGGVFAQSTFAKQIAEIELELTPDNVVRFCNIDIVRTVADARNAVRTYWLLLEKF